MKYSIIWVGVLLFVHTALGAWQDDAWYTDKYFHQKVHFTQSSDEIFIVYQTADNESRQQIQRQFNLTPVQMNSKGTRVIYSINNQDTLILCREIESMQGVGSAYPIISDQNGFKKPVLSNAVTVQFKPAVDYASCRNILTEIGCQVITGHWTPGYFTVRIPAGYSVFQTIRFLNQRDDVLFSEFCIGGFQDWSFTPNDTYFSQQQNLDNTGQVSSCECEPYSDHDIDAKSAWEMTSGDPNIIIALVDTGVQLDHPDLAANILDRGEEDWDFSSEIGVEPVDEDGHGTACAGIIAAVTDNDLGVSGIAFDCKIMPLKVDLDGGFYDQRADAINYAASRVPYFDGMVISNSWVMSSGGTDAVYNAIASAKAAGCVVVFGAGNTDTSPVQPPADSTSCITVSALSPCDERANPISCDGDYLWGSSYGTAVDISAPGVLIRTLGLNSSVVSDFAGTSAACPHVAAAAALILSLAPELTPDEVQSILEQSADDLDLPGWDQYTGYGRMNLWQALLQVNSVVLDQVAYSCEDTAMIDVRDDTAAVQVTVVVTSDQESQGETVILPESSTAGEFSGTIPISSAPPQSGDGIISVLDGGFIEVLYPVTGKSDSAEIDCTFPEISNIITGQIEADALKITWDTNEPCTSEVNYGVAAPLEYTVRTLQLVNHHEIQLTDLDNCTQYLFSVGGQDYAGNRTVDDNAGLYYSVETLGLVAFVNEDMSADPGWIMEGLWAWGVPTGQDGDPTSGYTGENVLGYNLEGPYEDSIQLPFYVTTTPIDCSESADVILSYWQWLAMESSQYDHATVELSVDGGETWHVIWEFSGPTVIPEAWSYTELDISQWAQEQPDVRLRWGMGPSDSSVHHGGWNLDDIQISYTAPCHVPLLAFMGVDVDDEAGNDDGLLSGGEIINLWVTLHNYGTPATNITTTLLSDNPCLSIISPTAAFPDLNTEEQSENSQPYVIQTNSGLVDHDIVNFILGWTSAESMGSTEFNIEAVQPALLLVESYLDDSGGDNDGFLDPGETASLQIKVRNEGRLNASATSADATCNYPQFLTFPTGHAEIGDVPVDDSAWTVSPHFILNAAASTPEDTTVTITFHIIADGYEKQQSMQVNITGSNFGPRFQWNMSEDPGWTVEGSWEWGQPLGQGNDPTSGYTGENVYGYNLAGQYTNNLPETALITNPVNCSHLSEVEVHFMRWLGLESSQYDHASFWISNDSVEWTQIWTYEGPTMTDPDWQLLSYDISQYADHQPAVVLKWVMGPTDGSVTGCGWNLDDVEIWGQYSGSTATPTPFVTPTPATSPTTPPCVHNGDVDGSGTITPNDALQAFEIYLGTFPNPGYEDLCRSDCDGSGETTPADALCIFVHYLSGGCECADDID